MIFYWLLALTIPSQHLLSTQYIYSAQNFRYFTNQEISQLFLLGHTTYSETCNQLEELHGAARNHSEQIKTDVKEITKLGMGLLVFLKAFHIYIFFLKIDWLDSPKSTIKKYHLSVLYLSISLLVRLRYAIGDTWRFIVSFVINMWVNCTPSITGAIGCSDHDLLFSHEEEVENTPEEKQYVDNMVRLSVINGMNLIWPHKNNLFVCFSTIQETCNPCL